MWFKRNKKADPDSALTDSLRSLQTLLSENTDGKRVEPSVPNAEKAGNSEPLIQDTDATPILARTTEEDGIPVLMDDVDPAPSLRPGVRINLPTRDTDEADQTEPDDDKTGDEDTDDFVEEYTEYNIGPVGSTNQDGAQLIDEDDTPTFDNIPILNDVVSTSEQRPPSGPSSEEIKAKEALIEASIVDFEQRLEQAKLPTLTEQDKQKLRQTFALLLVTRNPIDPV